MVAHVRVGALPTLMLFGIDFSLIGLFGIILLIGILKKNRIMMMTVAAILAGLPAMLGHGTCFEICQPLGYAIVGALR